jgi:ATP-dependent RNA helicase RhlE
MKFSNLGLAVPILKAIEQKGYTETTPVQDEAIPPILKGRDVLAAAQTGTGKTAAFTLPMLHLLSSKEKVASNHTRALILTPTRELAAQILENIESYGRNLNLRSAVVFGGVKINPQMMNLRKGVDILVATPGRLLDLYSQNAVKFKQLEILVLDEADRMLDMGFIHDIKKIIALLPAKRQNLMFSATFSQEIRKLASAIVHNPVEIAISPTLTTIEAIQQWVYPVDKNQKSPLLCQLITENNWKQVLVFCRTKHGANRLALQLTKKNIQASPIHGNKSQGARTKALADFKEGRVRVLVATDIAARGLDIDQLPHVINYELPNVPADYVHRIGRTGRAGASGEAISLVCADEAQELFDIEAFIKQDIEQRVIGGFEPVNPLPDSQGGKRPSKPKPADKARVAHPDKRRYGSSSEHKKVVKANPKKPYRHKGSESKSEVKSPTPSSPQRSSVAKKSLGSKIKRFFKK